MGNGFQGRVAVGVYDYPGTRDYDDWSDVINNTPIGTTSSTSSGKSPVDVSVNVPTSQIGVAVPYLIGRQLVSSPCVLSYGNLVPIMQTDSETTTTVETVNVIREGLPYSAEITTSHVVETTYIVGYRMDLQLGICLGPDVKLVGIYYNQTKVWTGTLGPARGSITLPAGLGAIGGATLIFHGGAFDQTRDPIYTDPDIPGYVGLAYVIIQNIRADLPLDAIWFEVERFPNPLGLTSSQNRYLDDVNSITAIVDILTSDWGGAGLAITDINTTLIKEKAIIVANEHNYCSIIEDGNASIKGLVGTLLGQINGIAYQNPGTGKLELALVRKEFAFNLDNALGASDLISLRDFDKGSQNSVLSKLMGSYTDRSLNYKPNTISAQPNNVKNKSKIGSRNYGYVTNKALCRDLLGRDFARASTPLFGLSFEATRKAAELLPGSVVTLSWGEYHLYGVPVFVNKVSKMPIDENSVLVEATQLLTANVSPVFDMGEAINPNIDLTPLAPVEAKFVTVPYWIARSIGMLKSSLNVNIVSAIVLPVPVNNMQSSFAVYSKYMASGSESAQYIKYVNDGLYPTYAELLLPVTKYDGWTTGKLTDIKITNVINPINLVNIGLAGVKSGRLLAFIGNEIISFESVTQTGVGEYTLTNVYRGLLDTVAEDHAIGAEILIINNNYRSVLTAMFDYPLTGLPDFLILSSTAQILGDLDVDSTWNIFSDAWAAANSRTLSPLRPTDTKLNGTRNIIPVDILLSSDITVSWKNRARTGQVILSQIDATEAGEVSVKGNYQYVDIMIGDVSVWQSDKTAATPTSATVTLPDTGVPLGAQTLYVRSSLDFDFGTLSSVYHDDLQVNVLPGDMYLSEDSASYFVSEDDLTVYVQE